MAHDCPECGMQCHCNGDIDDINFGESDECKCCIDKLYGDNDEEDYEDDFDCCDNCDLPDACADFGCAISSGIKQHPEW